MINTFFTITKVRYSLLRKVLAIIGQWSFRYILSGWILRFSSVTSYSIVKEFDFTVIFIEDSSPVMCFWYLWYCKMFSRLLLPRHQKSFNKTLIDWKFVPEIDNVSLIKVVVCVLLEKRIQEKWCFKFLTCHLDTSFGRFVFTLSA